MVSGRRRLRGPKGKHGFPGVRKLLSKNKETVSFDNTRVSCPFIITQFTHEAEQRISGFRILSSYLKQQLLYTAPAAKCVSPPF